MNCSEAKHTTQSTQQPSTSSTPFTTQTPQPNSLDSTTKALIIICPIIIIILALIVAICLFKLIKKRNSGENRILREESRNFPRYECFRMSVLSEMSENNMLLWRLKKLIAVCRFWVMALNSLINSKISILMRWICCHGFSFVSYSWLFCCLFLIEVLLLDRGFPHFLCAHFTLVSSYMLANIEYFAGSCTCKVFNRRIWYNIRRCSTHRAFSPYKLLYIIVMQLCISLL